MTHLVIAQAVDNQLDPLVVTGARIEQKLSDVLPSVTVITREEIERAQVTSVADLLQGEPGFEFGRNGGLGSQTSFFLRGENSVSTAVFVDGIRAQTDGYANINAMQLSPNLIDRIEIYRGNAGALYGEAAIGGVINIFTRQNADGAPKANASVMYGSRNMVDAAASYGGQTNNTRFNIAVNHQSTDGFPALNVARFPNANPNSRGFTGDGLTATVSQQLTKEWDVGLVTRYQRNDVGYEDPYGSTAPTTLLNQKTTDASLTAFAKYKILENWSTRLEVTQSDIQYDFYSKTDPQLTKADGSNYSTNSKQLTSRWTTLYQIDANRTLNAGIENLRMTLDDGNSKDIKRDTTAYFSGYNQRINAWDLQLNARHDDLTVRQASGGLSGVDYGKSTGFAGLGYQVNDQLKLTASRSSSFRAPAIGELLGYGGNLNVKPETHTSTELGFVYSQANWLARLVHFDTHTSNAISYDSQSNVVNIPTVKNSGYELASRAQFGNTYVKAALTLQDPIDVSTGEQLARRAKTFGSLDLGRTYQQFDFGTKVIFSGTRPDSAADTFAPTTLRAYQVWNFYAGMKLTDEIKLRVKLENAFNERYELASGYNTPSRGVFATLIYQQK